MENEPMTHTVLNRPTTDMPRIYVACLASYNAGELHGAWIDVDGDADDLQVAIGKMLAASPERDAEEWAIHDFEGFGSLHLEEYASLERVAAMAELVREHGEELAGEVLNHFGGDVEEAREALEDNYQGCHASLEDYAEAFMEDTGSLEGVPESIRPYIDYERMARDWELGGDIFTVETSYNEVHVFWNR
jgi:antirestriction protein